MPHILSRLLPRPLLQLPRAPILTLQTKRRISYTRVDELLNGISRQYDVVRDEFEVAVSSKRSQKPYATDDISSAREELRKLKELVSAALAQSTPQEVGEINRRVGQRIREVESAFERVL